MFSLMKAGEGEGVFMFIGLVRTELVTPDLICPSTYHLLRNSSGDSGPDFSFDKSASLECLFGLARASLVAISMLYFSFGCSEGDYTSSFLNQEVSIVSRQDPRWKLKTSSRRKQETYQRNQHQESRAPLGKIPVGAIKYNRTIMKHI
ncbi:hypothetical protein Tco_1081421 [Tanacetum coccineum]|uniref:Uncharacterized protein n=1 Tax=Tanacetum coccineum TaxID=301880 RepID=A0ABQ5HYQ1_9ASTR